LKAQQVNIGNRTLNYTKHHSTDDGESKSSHFFGINKCKIKMRAWKPIKKADKNDLVL
jgi:hypothetical protein